MKKYVITISRQFGSLGRPIARHLSELLGIEFYDRDIVEEAGRKLGMPVSEISDQEEMAKSTFFRMSYPLGTSTSEIQDKIFAAQRQFILEKADKESCIMVGRCSDFILAEQPNHLSVFIYAPYEARYENCINSLNMKPEDAKKAIERVDKARDAYHLKFAKYLPSDFRHMDIMIDSSVLGERGTAEYLAEFVKRKFAE